MQVGSANAYEFGGYKKDAKSVFYKPTKGVVLHTLDRMKVDYKLDSDGDVAYKMQKKGWKGYVIFSYVGEARELWSVQVRTQFATKPENYHEVLTYVNNWNANQRQPKLAMKNREKMVLSINYPVQFGFNPREFEVNVYKMLNNMSEKIGEEIKSMLR
jgi:hypothetical protein